jgi:subtilisin
LLREGLGRGGAQVLQNASGLRVSMSADDEGPARHHLFPGERALFHQVGAALVHADPDQLAALSGHTGNSFVTIEPERVVTAIQLAGAVAGEGGVSENTDAWGLQTTRVAESRFSGRGVRVSVLDTGLDLQHPDFVGRSIVSQSFVAGALVDDGNGHGTYCVGVACGPSSPSQLPRYGVAGDAELYVGKVIGDDGSGTDGSILAGIDWAVRGGCAIVSLSMGSPVAVGEPYSPVYEQVAQRALAAGTVIMAAASSVSNGQRNEYGHSLCSGGRRLVGRSQSNRARP